MAHHQVVIETRPAMDGGFLVVASDGPRRVLAMAAAWAPDEVGARRSLQYRIRREMPQGDTFDFLHAENFFGPVRFALSRDFPWDGEGIPAIVELFAEGPDGEMVPALASSGARFSFIGGEG